VSQNKLLLLVARLCTWAAWYNSWLLIELMQKGAVFSRLFFSRHCNVSALTVAGDLACYFRVMYVQIDMMQCQGHGAIY